MVINEPFDKEKRKKNLVILNDMEPELQLSKEDYAKRNNTDVTRIFDAIGVNLNFKTCFRREKREFL